MKRFLIIALCLAGLAGMAAAQPNPWDPNYYTGTFHGHGDFVPKGNGVWDLGDPGNHWRKAYVDSLLGAALIGYADSSHRADSVLFQGSYISLSKYLYTLFNDSSMFFGRHAGNAGAYRYCNAFGYGAMDSAGGNSNLFNNAFGFEALKMSGSDGASNGNNAFGHKALNRLRNGVDNNAFGLNAMRDMTDGNNNTAYGDQALMLAVDGDQNSAFGQSAMLSADSCYKNAAFGVEALVNTIGSGNIGIGYQALYHNLRSNYRIGIGYQVDAAVWPDTLRQDTTIAIGFKASSDSQGIAMGDSAVAMLKNSGALGNHVTARLRNYFTILNIDSDTLRSAQGVLLAATKPIQWDGGARLYDTLGTRLRGISVSFDSTWTDYVQARTAGTGWLGAIGNPYNHSNQDSVFLADSLFAYKIGTDMVVRADTFKVISPDNTVRVMAYSNTGSNRIHMPVATDFLAGMLATTGNFSSTITTNGGNITTTKVGGVAGADTISGYNGNTWAVNSWGITITGVDTLGKFYMSSFDSLKMVRCWASIKTASIGGDPDTLVYMDSLKTDSVKVTMAVGSFWLAPAVLNKKWSTNPGGVLNPVYCIFRKGATTAAANLQVWTTYGLSKGRMF